MKAFITLALILAASPALAGVCPPHEMFKDGICAAKPDPSTDYPAGGDADDDGDTED